MGAHGWVAALCQPWGRYSVLGLAAKSGSPWTFQAPNLHEAMQLLKYNCYFRNAVGRVGSTHLLLMYVILDSMPESSISDLTGKNVH